MRLVMSVCVHTYMYVRIYIYIYILLQNLLNVICCLLFEFKCLQCARGLLHQASYTDRAIHALPNKTRRPPGPKIISSEQALMACHTLCATTASMLCMFVCRLAHTVQNASNKSGNPLHMQYSELTCCSLRTGHVLFGTLVLEIF